MASEIVTVVDPNAGSGYNYDSLVDWEADLGNTTSGDLVTYDEIAVAKCRCTGGSADPSLFCIDGWTCDSTRYIKIWTDPTETYRHEGKYPTGNKYRLEPTEDDQNSILIVENYVRIIGIAMRVTSNVSRTEYMRAVKFGDSGYPCVQGTVSHCVIYDQRGLANCYGVETAGDATGPFYIYNNVVYNFSGTNSHGISFSHETTTQTGYIYNNTAHGCATGINTTRYQQQDVINNLVHGCTTAFNGDWRYAYNNSTDSATAPSYSSGADNRTSQSFSFVDVTNHDFHLKGDDTGAKGYGKNLYNDTNLAFQDDIDGNDRGGSGATWDIGADEYMESLLLKRINVLLRM